MSKVSFVFVGDGDNDPDEITVWGLRFELDGDPVELDDEGLTKQAPGQLPVKNSMIVAKLRGNPNFHEVGADGDRRPSFEDDGNGENVSRTHHAKPTAVKRPRGRPRTVF